MSTTGDDARHLADDAAPVLGDADKLIRDAKDTITGSGHNSRELSLVLTKLDEALLWLSEHLSRAKE